MKKCAPFHIKDFCWCAKEDKAYNQLVDEYEDDYHFVYKIECACGNKKFEVYKDDHPTVVLRCSNCRRNITVYDLEYYPAATKLKEEMERNQIVNQEDNLFNVYAIYEYSDEFEDDSEFDANDITWCFVFITDIKSRKLIKLVDDETA